MRRLRKGFVTATVCLLSVSSSRSQETIADRDWSRKHAPTTTKARLEQAIPELMRKGEVPGLQIDLIENGKTTWLGDFGVRNSATKQPVTDNTIFEAASLSKTVFAFSVLKLVDQGKLDLDAPLINYLHKPYIEGDPRLNLITARIVLSHRTGFPNWRGDGNTLTIRFTPGSRFSYSGEGFVYLQKVVEQITGKPLNKYVTEAVFRPLRMKSSSYTWRPEFEDRTATGHDSSGQTRTKNKPTEANAAASLHTTAADYALFLEAVMSGVGLKPATLKLMESPEIAVDPACTNCTGLPQGELSHELFWGLGWGIANTDRGQMLWHWGDNGAFKCFVAAYPQQKQGVVFFTNGENGLSIAEEIVRLALGADPPLFRWIKYDSYDSVAMRFSTAVRNKGVAVAITEFEKNLKDGTVPENSIDASGYRLLDQNKVTDAITIFQLNVQLHPDSWNAYDSLGEAYLHQGDTQKAIDNYDKSLQLNPNNSGAAQALKKLRTR